MADEIIERYITEFETRTKGTEQVRTQIAESMRAAAQEAEQAATRIDAALTRVQARAQQPLQGLLSYLRPTATPTGARIGWEQLNDPATVAAVLSGQARFAGGAPFLPGVPPPPPAPLPPTPIPPPRAPITGTLGERLLEYRSRYQIPIAEQATIPATTLRRLQEQAIATTGAKEAMKLYGDQVITSAEKNMLLAKSLEQSNRGFQRIWQSSFALFGIAMALNSTFREIEVSTGQKLPPALHALERGVQTISSLTLAGSSIGMFFGPTGGIVGTAAGAGLGAIVALLAGLNQVPEGIQELNKALESLAKKDRTVDTLSQITGWTKESSEWALTAAKNYTDLAEALDRIRKASAPTDFWEGIDRALAQSGIYRFLRGYPDDILQQYEQQQGARTRQASDAASRQMEIARTRARFQPLQDVAERGVTSASRVLQDVTGWTDEYTDAVLKAAGADRIFADQFKESADDIAGYEVALAKLAQGIQAHGRDVSEAFLKERIEAEKRKLATGQEESAARAAARAIPTLTDYKKYTPAAEKEISTAAERIGKEYLDALKRGGYDTKLLEQEWAKIKLLVWDSADGLHEYAGAAAWARNLAEQEYELRRRNLIPGYQVQPKLTGADLAKDVALAGRIAADQMAQTRRISAEAGDALQKQWDAMPKLVLRYGNSVQIVSGYLGEHIALARQLNEAWQNPTLQVVPELTPDRAGRLQANLTQAENLMRRMGVRQEPQEYLMFGKGGFLAKYITSSEAMTLAMTLLREEVQRETEATRESNQLRGHYNIPTAFGYRPPTPWEYYSQTGATDMGPVNYPWMFPDKSKAGKSPEYYLGMIASGLSGTYPTTFGSSVSQFANAVNIFAQATNPATMAGYGIASEYEYALPMGYTMGRGTAHSATPTNLVALADAFSRQYGMTDPNILRAIIQAESNWNPNAIGDKGYSIGLLQNYMKGGRGTGYTKEQLLDPYFNIELGMPEISSWYRKGVAGGLAGAQLAMYVGQHAQRPAAGMEQNYFRAYEQLASGKPIHVQGLPGLTSTVQTGDARANALLSQISVQLGRIYAQLGKPPVVNVYNTGQVTTTTRTAPAPATPAATSPSTRGMAGTGARDILYPI